MALVYATQLDGVAYFAWLSEPGTAKKGPRLIHHLEPEAVPFDRKVLNRIVARVVRWHDAADAKAVA